MGAFCDTICHRKASAYQTLPNTESFKVRVTSPTTGDTEQIEGGEDTLPILKDATTSTKPEDVKRDLLEAIEKGNTDMITVLNEEYRQMGLLKTKWMYEDTCLHLAVRLKHYSVIEYLLKNGIEVNSFSTHCILFFISKFGTIS